MKNSINKPWDNIPITDIQPYPSNYTKIVITSYILTAVFVFFNIFGDINLTNNGFDSLISLIVNILVYGVFAFTLLYFYAQGNRKLMISDFLTDTTIIIAFFIIYLIIFILINGFLTNSGTIDLNPELFKMIPVSLYSLFLIIAFLHGPFSLLEMDHPKATIHGLITTITFLAIFLDYVFLF